MLKVWSVGYTRRPCGPSAYLFTLGSRVTHARQRQRATSAWKNASARTRRVRIVQGCARRSATRAVFARMCSFFSATPSGHAHDACSDYCKGGMLPTHLDARSRSAIRRRINGFARKGLAIAIDAEHGCGWTKQGEPSGPSSWVIGGSHARLCKRTLQGRDHPFTSVLVNVPLTPSDTFRFGCTSPGRAAKVRPTRLSALHFCGLVGPREAS